MYHAAARNLLIGAIACVICACQHQQYTAKPIDLETNHTVLMQQLLDSPAFSAFLTKHGYTLPVQQWSLETLTLAAVFHHAEMRVARSQLALATLAAEAAGLPPRMRIGGSLAKSNQKNGDIRPWAYGLTLDIPIVTNQKQAIVIEQASYGVEAAEVRLAQQAWALREALASSLIQLRQLQAQASTLAALSETHDAQVNLYQKRLANGMASSVELSRAKIAQQKQQFKIEQVQIAIIQTLKQIAAQAGVPSQQLKLEEIAFEEIDQLMIDKAIDLKSLQTSMLTNRLDIRAALVTYAQAEAGLKLEVAKQIPDINLSPGVIFEFGDTVWSLGIDTLLAALKRNDLMIARAQQVRTVEAAHVAALQSQRLSDLSLVYADYQQKHHQLAAQTNSVALEKAYYQQLEKQFNVGLIDRLALMQGKQGLLEAEILRLAAETQLLEAAQALENLLQKPMPADISKIASLVH